MLCWGGGGGGGSVLKTKQKNYALLPLVLNYFFKSKPTPRQQQFNFSGRKKKGGGVHYINLKKSVLGTA